MSIVLGLALIALPAQAYEKGDWIVRVGDGMVDPKSGNSDIVSVDDGTSLVVNGTYFFTPTIGFESLAAWPFSHDIKLANGGSKVAETKHLPPSFSIQYPFAGDAAFRPFVGAGLNFTTFFDEETTGALEGASLSLDDSLGLALHLGADFDVSDTMFLNFDVRWIDIESEATVGTGDGDLVFDVAIDPMVYSVTLGWKF